MISFENVKKSYGHVTALDGLTMHVEDGALYALVGPNGAGKTTALRMLLGLVYPDSGQVLIDDMEAGADVRRLKRRIGYVPDRIGAYPNLRVSEYMDFFADCYDLSGVKTKRQIQMLLDLVGLRDRQGQYMDSLSRGMQQKLSLARALIHDPKILVMDEPTANLDCGNSALVMERVTALAGAGFTVIFSTHDPNQAFRYATRVLALQGGGVLAMGEPEKALTGEMLTKLYGVGMAVCPVTAAGKSFSVAVVTGGKTQ